MPHYFIPMLSVIMLNVVVLSVVAPYPAGKDRAYQLLRDYRNTLKMVFIHKRSSLLSQINENGKKVL